jgi:hypothetical protein
MAGLDPHQERAVAVAASVDPRTVRKFLQRARQARPVQNAIREALVKLGHGALVPAFVQEQIDAARSREAESARVAGLVAIGGCPCGSGQANGQCPQDFAAAQRHAVYLGALVPQPRDGETPRPEAHPVPGLPGVVSYDHPLPEAK